MKALLLAAGRGSRLGPLTAEKPKCLAVLLGKTLLDWQLESLKEAGITKVGVVRGYNGHLLERSGVTYFENPQWQSTNMVMSLMCASAWLESDSCLVSYSDIVYSPKHARDLMSCSHPLALTYDVLWKDLWKLRAEDYLADAETFKIGADGFLTEIGRKTADEKEIEGQYMGLVKITPPAWVRMKACIAEFPEEQRRRLDMTTLLQKLISRGEKLFPIPVRGKWCEVDTEGDLKIYERCLAAGPWTHDWRERE